MQLGTAAAGGVAVRAQAGGGAGRRPTARARAQVAYARWLVTWGMELEDKKLRPSGSPPRDGVLADLAHQLCAFPAHAPDCKFATFYRRACPPALTLPYNFPGVALRMAALCRVAEPLQMVYGVWCASSRRPRREL